jgi:PQQ-like domain
VPGEAPARPLASAFGRVPREVVLTAVAALLLGGTGVAVAHVAAERALDARLARVPGLVSSLAAPLREDWHAPGGGLVATMDDVVVHWDHDAMGLVGTDVADGSTRYSVPGMCQLVPTEGDLQDRFTGMGTTSQTVPGDVLLCLEGGGAGSIDLFGARETMAHVVDPATGETRQRFSMVAGDMWNVVDGDVVSIGLDADRRVVAGRWSLRTGQQRWTHHGTEPAPRAGAGSSTTMDEGTIGLQLGKWSVTLDVETGAETHETARRAHAEFAHTARLPDGGLLEYGTSASGGIRTTVHPPDGGEPVTVPGVVLPPAVDDGSLPGSAVVLDVDGAAQTRTPLGLVDLASGERRWTASGVQGGEVGVLQGVVVVADGARTIALDGRTGETRWESRRAPMSYIAGRELVTDGRRVLVVDGVGANREIVARDVRTGERVWGTTPPFTDTALVTLPDGTVLAVGPYEMAALRR